MLRTWLSCPGCKAESLRLYFHHRVNFPSSVAGKMTSPVCPLVFERMNLGLYQIDGLDGALMMKGMVHRFAFVLAVALLCVGCTSTDFQSWEGRNSVVEGRDGT